MARERYLIGVNTEELQKEKKPELPLTFQQKVVKFWYNHHWSVIFVAVVLVLAILAGILIGSREKVDYTLVVVTKGNLAQTALDELAEELERFGNDIDQNGEVNVRVLPIVMSDEGDYVELATLFASGNAVFFAMEPEYYRSQIEEWETDDEYYFTTLSGDHEGLAEHKRYWNWKGSLFQQYSSSAYPENLYFGVRLPIGTAIGCAQESADCTALLETFIRENPIQN